ncbi:MAG TPA: VOC family protein [Thermomicrobiales bacterium]|jgi:catechol 2,3-dioxygenase-like lactoylglutathione lyase family enzyme|nr:VOC family protein [Thermomicrobiales bacterium]
MAGIRFEAVTIDCPDAPALARFYHDLTGMEIEQVPDDTFPTISAHGVALAFQPVEGYRPPTWPTQERGQQLHLDFVTDDIPAAVAYAESIGATRAPAPPEDDFTVMLDPAGHPFCLAAPFTDLEEYAQRREIRRDGIPTITLAGVNVDCPELAPMIRFYLGLTGMEYREPAGEYPKLVGENGLLYLFQDVEGYRPSTWPTQERGQQMHIDYLVRDLDAAVAQAERLGATVADREAGRYFVVMLDPAGHPFCLCQRS